MLQSSGQNNKSIGQFSAVVNKSLLRVFGSMDKSIVFIQGLQCVQFRGISGTVCATLISFMKPYGFANMEDSLNVTFQNEALLFNVSVFIWHYG